MTISGSGTGANGFDPDFADPPQWAAMYRAHRFQVVPAWSPAEHKQWKRPRLKGWREIQSELIPQADFDRIWAENATRRNMGLITGPCSDNQFIIDLDTQKTTSANEWWNGLLAVHNNNLPFETVEQRTGGGGRQLLFRAPAGVVVPTCKTARGVDIRGHGGFAMLPPSMHESGVEYAWLPGQAPGEVDVAEAPTWLLDAIAALVKEHGGAAGQSFGREGGFTARPAVDPAIAVDAFGNVTDGREQVMRDVVWHAVLEMYRQAPMMRPESAWPALAEEAYGEYERKVQTKEFYANKRDGLEQEKRGPTLFWQKFQAAMRRWGDEGFVRDAKQPAPEPRPVTDEADKTDPQLYERLTVDDILNMPDPKWLVADLIVENALGFIFGAPSSVKTFFALDLSLSLATGQTEWWGRQIGQNGTVVYISSEGFSDLKFRLLAWEQHRGVKISGIPFRLIRESINFTQKGDIERLLATVQAIADETQQPIAAVFVDTVSRVLPGVDENLQKDMTTFVNGCDAVRKTFGTTVIGLHHVSKAGGMRGSTVIPAAGDFVIEMRREVGEMEGSFYVSKLKAGEDGDTQHFKVTKLELGPFGTQTSLVLDPIDAPDAAGKWPDQNMRDRILYAITEGWAMGKPWSSSPQSGERYAPRIMQVKFKIPARIGKEWMEKALIDEVLVNEIYNTESKMRGLKVVPHVAPQ